MLLTKLDLGKNKIARVEGLETLSQLTQALYSDELEFDEIHVGVELLPHAVSTHTLLSRYHYHHSFIISYRSSHSRITR